MFYIFLIVYEISLFSTETQEQTEHGAEEQERSNPSEPADKEKGEWKAHGIFK